MAVKKKSNLNSSKELSLKESRVEGNQTHHDDIAQLTLAYQ